MFRILTVLVPDLRSERWELGLSRFIAPYYAFLDFGAEVVLASPLGGLPFDGLSGLDRVSGDLVRRFSADSTAREAVLDTLSLDQVCIDDFDAAFCLGAIWEESVLEGVGRIMAGCMESGKTVVAVPSGSDMPPRGPGRGLLILVGSEAPSELGAKALLGALGRK
jgi:hypothetical protein